MYRTNYNKGELTMTKQELNDYISENACDVADLATLDAMNKTRDPHYQRTLQRQLSRKYEGQFLTAKRAKEFPR